MSVGEDIGVIVLGIPVLVEHIVVKQLEQFRNKDAVAAFYVLDAVAASDAVDLRETVQGVADSSLRG